MNRILAVGTLAVALVAALSLTLAATAQAGPVLDRVVASGNLRVCIQAEAADATSRSAGLPRFEGPGVDLSRALARDLSVWVEHVDSSWPALVDNLLEDRCDIAVFAPGRLPRRQASLKSSRLCLRGDLDGAAASRAAQPLKAHDPVPRCKPAGAYAVKAGDEAWLRRVDAFFARSPSDRQLASAARRHGPDGFAQPD